MARIVAITDTYDALTTQRSYNVPMTPRNALEFMNNKLKGRYDNDLMRAMYEVLLKWKKKSSLSCQIERAYVCELEIYGTIKRLFF